jgi:hypothetical protein
MWDLWWTKWHWDRFFPEYFGLPLSVSFHRYSITCKNLKKSIHLQHRVAQCASIGCGASVVSAAGPFIKKEGNICTGHTQKNGAVLIVFTIKTAPFFCVCPVYITIS